MSQKGSMYCKKVSEENRFWRQEVLKIRSWRH